MQVWRNFQVLSHQTSDSSAFLNAMCLLKYALNCEKHSSFFIFQSGLTVTGLARVRCIPYEIHLYHLAYMEWAGSNFNVSNLYVGGTQLESRLHTHNPNRVFRGIPQTLHEYYGKQFKISSRNIRPWAFNHNWLLPLTGVLSTPRDALIIVLANNNAEKYVTSFENTHAQVA
jgi:hypothetical protein